MAPPGLCQSYKLNCDLSEPGNDFPISDLTGFPANKLTPHSNYHKYKYVSNCCNNPTNYTASAQFRTINIESCGAYEAPD